MSGYPRTRFKGAVRRYHCFFFFQPAYYHEPRQRKTEPRACLCYFLDFWYNHGRRYLKLLDESYTRATSSGTTRRYRGLPWFGMRQWWCRGTFTYPYQNLCLCRVVSHPNTTSANSCTDCVTACVINHRDDDNASATGFVKGTSNNIACCVGTPCSDPRARSSRIKHERYQEMPGRTRGEARALRDETW